MAGIADRLSGSAAQLDSEAGRLEAERNQILGRLATARQELQDCVGGEYREVVVAGRSYQPSEAARLVLQGAEIDAWIPGPIDSGAPLPLAPSEVAELYATNAAVSPADEREIDTHLPAPDVAPAPGSLRPARRGRSRAPGRGPRDRVPLLAHGAAGARSRGGRTAPDRRGGDAGRAGNGRRLDAGPRPGGPARRRPPPGLGHADRGRPSLGRGGRRLRASDRRARPRAARRRRRPRAPAAHRGDARAHRQGREARRAEHPLPPEVEALPGHRDRRRARPQHPGSLRRAARADHAAAEPAGAARPLGPADGADRRSPGGAARRPARAGRRPPRRDAGVVPGLASADLGAVRGAPLRERPRLAGDAPAGAPRPGDVRRAHPPPPRRVGVLAPGAPCARRRRPPVRGARPTRLPVRDAPARVRGRRSGRGAAPARRGRRPRRTGLRERVRRPRRPPRAGDRPRAAARAAAHAGGRGADLVGAGRRARRRPRGGRAAGRRAAGLVLDAARGRSSTAGPPRRPPSCSGRSRTCVAGWRR